MSIIDKTNILIAFHKKQKLKEKKEKEKQDTFDLKNQLMIQELVTDVLKTIDGKRVGRFNINIKYFKESELPSIAWIYHDAISLFKVEYNNRWIDTYDDDGIRVKFFHPHIQISYLPFMKDECISKFIPFYEEELKSVCENFEDWIANYLADN